MTKPGRDGRRIGSNAGFGLSSLAVAGLVLSGCGTVSNLNPFNTLESRYGSQSDACYYARKPLIETGDVFAQSMIAGAAIGGATGVAAGALLAKDKVEGAVIGGVVGAAAGAAVGYLHAKQEQAKTRVELISSIDADAARDNHQLVTSSNAIASLTRCREDQIAGVERKYRDKTLTAAETRQQLQAIQVAMHDDNALIADVLGEAEKRSDTYVQARADSGAPIGGGHYRTAAPGAYVSTVNANVRGGPSTSGKVVDTLHVGETVEVVADAGNGWVTISHNGVKGYVARRLLAEANSSTARRAEERGGVSAAAAAATPAAPPPPVPAPQATASATPSPAPAAGALPAGAGAPASGAQAAAPPPAPSAPPPAAPAPAAPTATAASTPTPAPSAAPAAAPAPEAAPVEVAAAPPTAASDNGGTATFVRTNAEAERREEAHKQVESELQTRINNLPNSG